MTGYEQDFIYKTLPRLTNAIEGLTKEIKRYNDSKDRDMENIVKDIIIDALRAKGYDVTIDTDGIYIDEEDTTTGVKISVEIVP